MSTRNVRVDWDPRSPEVTRDQRAYYDHMRETLPVAYSELLHWSVFRHEDVVRILDDPKTFSNAVSRHISVPNGMDGAEHRTYRDIIDPYFSSERMKAFEPVCQSIVEELATEILGQGDVEVISQFAHPFAARVQCAFLGWPPELAPRLVDWTQRNQQATYAQDRPTLSAIAQELQQMIDEVIEARVRSGATADEDITASLMHEKVYGRRLNNQEIASILRNWTVGEIGTITASIGILVQYLAEHQELQDKLRAETHLLPEAIDEILRLNGPLGASRRVTTRPVELGGRRIEAGERITLMWVAANRDGRVFEEPYTFRFGRDQSQNLLYGRGVHVCPGAPLARLEMLLVVEELLRRTESITLVPDKPPRNAVYPACGYSSVYVQFA